MRKINKIALSIVLTAFVSLTAAIVTGASPLLFAAGIMVFGLVKGLFNINFSMPQNLAYNSLVISDTTYAGEAASQFIVRAITGNETVQGGHVYVKDGIKKKFTIPRFDVDYEDIIQDRQATPVSKGTMTVDGQTLTPADYMIYTEFNPRDFEDHWYAVQLGTRLLDRELPVTVESVITQEILKRNDRFTNKIIWGGDTTTTGIYKYFDGFVKKATDNANTLDLAATSILTTTLAANILAEMVRIYDLIPTALKYDPDVKFFMSYELYDAYAKAIIAQTNKGADVTSMEANLTYRGLRVIRIADMPANKMIIAKGSPDMTSNMWVGMNSTEDANIQIGRVANNSELYFLKMLCKLDVQFGWYQEVVNYV